MKLDPRHLEILAAVVDNGGVTEAARAIGKSQPSLSRTIILLENRVDRPLFVSNKRPLVPTEFCLQLAAEGRKILKANQAAGEIVSSYKAGRSGAVRLAGTPFFMDGVISGMIATFQTLHQDIRIDQSYCYPLDVFADLRNGVLDLGIIPILASEVPDDMTFDQILRGRNVIACRAGHSLTRKSVVRLNDLTSYPWIAPPVDSPLYHDLRAGLEGIGVKHFKISFTGGSLITLINVLSESDALTGLPYSVVFRMLPQNRLTALSIRIGDPERHLGILTLTNNRLEPAAKRLMNYITTEFKSLSAIIHHHEQNELWRK